MSETTNDLPAQSADEQQLEGIDDVEAHGLREVAAAASIGAAVIGAGGAALAASHAASSTPASRTPAVVQQTVRDADQLTGDTIKGADSLAGGALSDSRQLTSDTAKVATDAAAPTINQTKTNVSSVETATGNAVHAVTNYTDKTASGAVAKTDKTEATAFSTTRHTESKAVGTTDGAVKSTNATAHAKVQSVVTLVSASEDTVNRGWELNFSILGEQVGSQGHALTPSGTITVVNAHGQTIASAKVTNGKARIHLSALGQEERLTIHYGGDQNFTAAQMSWSGPVGF
jgi:hypothetical protein